VALAQSVAAAGLRGVVSAAVLLRSLRARGDTAAAVKASAGRALLETMFSVDLHGHPTVIPALRSRSAAAHARGIEAGRMRAIVLSAVGDLAAIGWRPERGIGVVRKPASGELYESTLRQLDALKRFADVAKLRPLRTPAELAAAAERKEPGHFLAIEGADFLEGRPERLQAVYERGVRSLQLVHYRINELGDIQTAPPRHGGLTPFGRDVVREANRLGVLLDLAHATFEVTKAVVECSMRPVMISHTNIHEDAGSPRFISREHARVVTDAGGLIGAWPFSPAPRFSAFIDRIMRLVDVVGPEHAAIGTDMDGLGPYAVFGDYAEWPSIPSALLARGLAAGDVANIMGGNFRRLFEKVALG